MPETDKTLVLAGLVSKHTAGGSLFVKVPDQNIYPQFVQFKGKVYLYHFMDGNRRIYIEVDCPEAQLDA